MNISRDGAYGLPPPTDDGADFHSRNGIDATGHGRSGRALGRGDTHADSDDSDANMKKHYRMDADNGLSQEKLKVYMDSVHARVKVKDKNGNITLEKRPFCATRSGWFCCRPS